MLLSIRNSLNKDANIILLIQSLRKEFEVRVYIKREKKIKKVISTITNNIIDKIRNANVEATLLIRKNIIAIKRQLDIVVFKVKTKKSKRILKKNNF